MSNKYKNLLNSYKNSDHSESVNEAYQASNMGDFQPRQQMPVVTTQYNPNEEMEEIKKMQSSGLNEENLVNSKLPKDILQSFIDNPIKVDTSIMNNGGDDITDQLINHGSVGREKFKQITEKMDRISPIKNRNENIDRPKFGAVNESTRPLNNGGGVDIEYLLYRINEMVDKKLSAITESVNNKQQNSGNPLKIMVENNKGFLFVDGDNNVYECKMIYKGKNKTKSK